MLRTAGLLALLTEDFVSGLRRRDFAPFSIRRRSATRRLGPYRDRTFTGKPRTASLDTQFFRTPASSPPLPEQDCPSLRRTPAIIQPATRPQRLRIPAAPGGF